MKMSSIAQKPERQDSRTKGTSQRQVRYTTVALIGPDGSGKTAVAKALLETCPLPLKYLYMGTSIESSNVALPTSRLIHKWKVYRHKKALARSGKVVPEKVTFHGLEHRIETRGKLGGIVRLLRRISEESYRQLVAWTYQIRGNIVLYDRHFLFDACPIPTADTRKNRLTDRIHFWFLKQLYPRPGLAIFLDAPADVLFARKQEVPLEYLERDRQHLMEKRCYARKFVLIDATQPLEEVLIIVNKLLLNHCAN